MIMHNLQINSDVVSRIITGDLYNYSHSENIRVDYLACEHEQ